MKIVHSRGRESQALPDGVSGFLPYGIGVITWTHQTEHIQSYDEVYEASTFTGLRILVSANATTAASTFETRKNQASGGMSITIGAGAIGLFTDLSGSDSCAAGDTMGYALHNGGGGAITVQWLAMDKEVDSGLEEVRVGTSAAALSANATRYYGWGSFGHTSTNTAEANRQARILSAVTAKYFRLITNVNSRTSNSTITSRKNGAAGNWSQIVAPTDDSVALEDTTSTDSLVAGDLYAHQAVAGGSGTQTLPWWAGISLIAAAGDPVTMIAGAFDNGDTQNANTTLYHHISLTRLWANGESNAEMRLLSPMRVSEMWVYVSANTVNGPTVITLRKNGAATGLAITIAASATGWHSATGVDVDYASGDDICIEVDTGGSTGTITQRNRSLLISEVPNALVPQDALHGHTAESPTLTQANTLVVQDATHGHTAESPTLAVAYTLSAQDALHGHTAESPTLSAALSLAVADALHGHTADNVALIQQNILSVFDALHGHTADNVALVQQNILAVADALHALSSESPSLVQAYLLAIQDALHGHTADNVALTQANVLAVLDALHGHTAESPSLIQANILAVLDALHGHLADNVDLTQQNLLVVHDAAHDLFFDNVILELQGFLGVQDSRHVHLADNVALTQQQILAVQDALHALSFESPTPTVAFVLVVNDAVHALLGESPVLSQAHVLAVQDALHLHTADNASVQVAYVLVPQDALHSLSSESPLLTIQFALTVQDALHALTSDMVIIGTLVAVPIKVGSVRAGAVVAGDVRTGAIIRGQGRVGPNIDLGVRS